MKARLIIIALIVFDDFIELLKKVFSFLTKSYKKNPKLLTIGKRLFWQLY